jgi:hypothetical protein
LTLVDAAQAIGPVFARHGYVFLFPFRRGEGRRPIKVTSSVTSWRARRTPRALPPRRICNLSFSARTTLAIAWQVWHFSRVYLRWMSTGSR